MFAEFVDSYVERFVCEENFMIPPGIARNKALRENIFTTVCCLENLVPLGIIGEVGVVLPLYNRSVSWMPC